MYNLWFPELCYSNQASILLVPLYTLYIFDVLNYISRNFQTNISFLRVIKIRYDNLSDKVSLLSWKHQGFSREKEISSFPPSSKQIQRKTEIPVLREREMGQREGGHALSQGRAFPANNCATVSTRWSIESEEISGARINLETRVWPSDLRAED